MQTDAPPLLIGGADHAPTMGLAAEVGSEDALAITPTCSPRAISAGRWERHAGVWKDQSLPSGDLFTSLDDACAVRQDDVHLPIPTIRAGTTSTRHPEGNIGGGEMFCQIGARGSEAIKRPIISADVVTEAYCRVEVWIDPETFWSSNYAFKFAGRYDHAAWLTNDSGGWGKGSSIYVFGSGQTSSDGRKSFDTKVQQWLYKGATACRTHTVGWPHRTATVYPDVIGLGFAPSHLGPYDGLRDGGVRTERCLDLFVTGGRTAPFGSTSSQRPMGDDGKPHQAQQHRPVGTGRIRQRQRATTASIRYGLDGVLCGRADHDGVDASSGHRRAETGHDGTTAVGQRPTTTSACAIAISPPNVTSDRRSRP